jgi:hypothetical protein
MRVIPLLILGTIVWGQRWVDKVMGGGRKTRDKLPGKGGEPS